MNSWDQIKATIAGKISGDAFTNWFANTSCLREIGGQLVIAVPDGQTRQYIEQEYGPAISSLIGELRLPVQRISYEVKTNGNGGNASLWDRHPAGMEGYSRVEPVFAPSISLNPKFTFETFVVGSCNQFAHAAAQAVATGPAKNYNPLFVYGGVGMGKTHLMHAIGRSLVDRYASMRVIYTSSERFMNEMINCIRFDRMPSFHRHYRSADVLLIDDIQVLCGKNATQEEFFHTFNELFEHGKQIVISSDSPPKSLPGLVDRVRSRCEWGLMVDVQPPDLETKMAILDRKAEIAGITLCEEVRIFIATRAKANVRELEGALLKLIAYSSVTNVPISLGMAQQVLKHLTQSQERKITLDIIMKAVAERHSLSPAMLKQKCNERRIVYPRQIAMYLAKELTNASLPEIGRAFGSKHHTTVLHSIRKIEQLRRGDAVLNKDIQALIESLQDS